jgi:hypothetical protein
MGLLLTLTITLMARLFRSYISCALGFHCLRPARQLFLVDSIARRFSSGTKALDDTQC